MELSDLTFFNNNLYSFDDRTGIVYEIDAERSQVWNLCPIKGLFLLTAFR